MNNPPGPTSRRLWMHGSSRTSTIEVRFRGDPRVPECECQRLTFGSRRPAQCTRKSRKVTVGHYEGKKWREKASSWQIDGGWAHLLNRRKGVCAYICTPSIGSLRRAITVVKEGVGRSVVLPPLPAAQSLTTRSPELQRRSTQASQSCNPHAS